MRAKTRVLSCILGERIKVCSLVGIWEVEEMKPSS